MSFTAFSRPSPNFGAAYPHEKLGVLVHHSVKNFDETIAYMLDPASQVSYHVLVAQNGARCTLVEDWQIAWHAGASNFLGRKRCNDFLLGLAFAGDTYAAPLTPEQIESALEWLSERWKRYQWNPGVITDHRQVSEGRKNDLAPSEWLRLHREIKNHFAIGML